MTFEVVGWKRLPSASGSPQSWDVAISDDQIALFEHGVAPSSQGYAGHAVPLWVHSQNLPYKSFVPVQVGSLDIAAPPGHAVIFGAPPATGRGTSHVTYTAIPAVRPGSFTFTTWEGLTGPTSYAVGAATWDVWIDRDLGAAEQAEIAAYLSGTSTTSLSSDVEYVEDRLGPQPLPYGTLAYFRQSVVTDPHTLGTRTEPGEHYVSGFEPDGAEHPYEGFEAVTIHEAAHAWFGGARGSVAGTRWLIEAMPSLLSNMRYPAERTHSRRFLGGLGYVVTATIGFDPITNLEADGNELGERADILRYYYGPYVLGQLHFAGLARGYSDAEIWSVYRDLTTTRFAGPEWPPAGEAVGYQEPLEPEEVALVAELLVGAAFYDEWISAARDEGTPLLGISGFSYEEAVLDTDIFDSDGAVDTDSDASDDSDGAADTDAIEDTDREVAAPRSAVIEQVQVALLGWSEYTTVPYFLGCYPALGAESEQAFEGCSATRTTLLSPGLSSTAETVIALAPNPALTVSATPAWLGVVANHMLLPEGAPAHLVSDGTLQDPDGVYRAPTWLLKCAAGDEILYPLCASDGDSDGYPTLGDCDDGDPDVNPGASELIGTDIDDNCDGWRGEMR